MSAASVIRSSESAPDNRIIRAGITVSSAIVQDSQTRRAQRTVFLGAMSGPSIRPRVTILLSVSALDFPTGQAIYQVLPPTIPSSEATRDYVTRPPAVIHLSVTTPGKRTRPEKTIRSLARKQASRIRSALTTLSSDARPVTTI